MDAKSCIIEKDTTFTHFVSKLLHISASKILHIYPLATIIVHIYTVTVACVYNILIIFESLIFFSLFSICKTNAPSLCSFFLWYTKSKINYKHKKSTTKSTTRTKSLDWWSVMWIGVDGDRWWVDGVQCWWRSVLMECLWWVDGDRCWWRSVLWVDGDQCW